LLLIAALYISDSFAKRNTQCLTSHGLCEEGLRTAQKTPNDRTNANEH